MLTFRFRQMYSTELFLSTQALWGPNLFLVNRQWYQPMLCITEQIQVNRLILGNVENYLENCILKLALYDYKLFCVVNKWKCARTFSIALFQGGEIRRKTEQPWRTENMNGAPRALRKGRSARHAADLFKAVFMAGLGRCTSLVGWIIELLWKGHHK